jgi:protein TonB
VESENKVQVVQAPVEDKGTQVAEVPKVDDDEGKVFNKVEIEAEYPGGPSAWTKYLKNNLDANTPIDNGATEGTYTVIVRFIVSKDGSISDVVAETKHGYGMEAEAMKIIKKGPKWTPAQQNGRYVNAYRRQPITFVVQEQ